MRIAFARRHVVVGATALLSPRTFALGAPAQRIVSLGGAVTEILYRLDRQADIVGVDSTSQFPPEALATKPNVGYVRALGAEGLLSLQPTAVLAIEHAGPSDVLRIVETAGVPITRIPDEPTPEGVLRRIETVAAAVGAHDKGAQLAREVEEGFSRLSAARSALKASRRVLFVLSLQNGRPLVGGRGTSADGMLKLAAALNAAAVDGWKPLSDEGVIAAAPDCIVMMSRGHDRPTASDVFARPSFAATPAAKSGALIVMDGLYLLGFGPRAPQAAFDLMAALYPEAGLNRGGGP